MKIGYLPGAENFSHPGDRRKFFRYLTLKKLPFELASFDSEYDVLYISIEKDLTIWSKYRSEHPNFKINIIFDCSDAYLDDSSFKNILRSFYHYLSGKSKYYNFSYSQTIRNMINCSDTLICGSPEQKQKLDPLHSNVVVIRDYFDMDIRSYKKSYDLVEKNSVHILWEGYSHGNKPIFLLMKKILSSVKMGNIHLHIIADNRYCAIGGSMLCKATYSVLENIFKNTPIVIHSYDWSPITFSSIATACDFAIIPIPNYPMMMKKPENKMLLLWSLGIPVIASATSAYKRVMDEIGKEMTCSNVEQWSEKIVELVSDKKKRIDYMKAVEKYLKDKYSTEIVTKEWDKIIQ